MFRQRLQVQKQVSKSDYRLFLETIAQLERYIEVAEHYWDWENRKWIHDNTVKPKDVIGNSEKAGELFLTQLFILSKKLEDMPSFFREELKEDFHRWIDTTRINVNNCPSKLKYFLLRLNEVLEGHGEKIKSEIKKSKSNLDPTSPECIEQFNKMFISSQTPLQGESKTQWPLEGKFFYKGLELKNELNADAERGQEEFEQIAKSVVNKHGGFHPFIQKSYQSSSSSSLPQIIQDVKNNPKNWMLNEIPTEVDEFGKIKKREFVLIHRNAQENNFWGGNLNFNNNLLYRWENFSAYQRFQIKKTLKISVDYLTEEEIKWVFKEDPRDWKVEKIEGQTYLVHNSSRIRKEEIGTLIHSEQKFSKTEWAEINRALKNCFLTKKKSNFANKECHNIKDQESKENEEEKKWPTCKAISCDNEPNYWIDYCSYHQKCLDKLQEYKSNVNDIRELETFTTWFNGNCGYVVCWDYDESCYRIFLVVYEPTQNDDKIKEVLETFEINSGYDKNSLESAKSKAASLRSGLNGENPILSIHPATNSYASFSEIAKRPYVTRVDLPYETKTELKVVSFSEFTDRREHSIGRFAEVSVRTPNKDPEKYLKFLDTVWVKKAAFPGVHFYHVGIYLGNNEICHIAGGKNDGRGIRKCSWETFTEGCISGEVFGYRSIIPFKHYELITKQISWAINNQWRENDYCLASQNCEHAANMIIYGIEYSKQVKENPGLAEFFGRKYDANKNKSGSFILKDETKRVNNRLGELDNKKAKEMKEKYETQIEVSNDCKIM